MCENSMHFKGVTVWTNFCKPDNLYIAYKINLVNGIH